MPTIFSHAVFASAIGNASGLKELGSRFWILTAVCSVLPDLDVIAFPLGISYSSPLGHRGFTHSIIFAVAIGLLVTAIFFPKAAVPKWKLTLYFGAVTLSHPLLDTLTDGGLGVALLSPFSNYRFFFPWRPVEVSPIGTGFFSERGVAVILSELVYIWIPAAVFVAASWLARRKG
jgi:inner membrane protein